MADSGLTKFAKKLTGYGDGYNGGWGIPTSGLVVFLVVLLIATVMLIVNGIYFIKVYDGSTDEDLNSYWSRGGALLLAVVNIIIASLLFIEFIIILRVLINRNSFDDPECLKNITSINPVSGLPKDEVIKKFKEANIAIATADRTKTGYVAGIDRAGALDENGLYIGPDYLTNETGYNTFRKEIKDERDTYALYDAISNATDVADLRRVDTTKNFYDISDNLTNPIYNKANTIPVGSDIDAYKRALLILNPPFKRDTNYEKDTRYKLEKLSDQYQVLSENPNTIPLVSTDALENNVFNPVPNNKPPFYDLRRRRV